MKHTGNEEKESHIKMVKMVKRLIPEFLKAPFRSYLHSRRYYRSQAGQDLWVFCEVFDGMRNGFFLNIGAHDGVELSNTYVLEKKYNWEGICIEANPESFEQLRRNRRVICVNACLDAGESFVTFVKRGMFGGIVSSDNDNKLDNREPELLEIKTVTLGHLLKR